jgi:serine/threonine-protein kinase
MARDLLPMVRQALDGRYVVDREIGRGGAARVFAARNKEGVQVALKVLHPQLAASVAAERFFREIHLIAPLEHPNIARLLDYGEEDWVLYYVMDFVEGPTLKQHLNGVRRAGIGDTLRIAHDVLAALACAHARGVVHRDVKPENVLLSPRGAVLVDFGIARAVSQAGADRLTRSGFAVGTSAYMSPEQIAGSDDIDARSDIYSLGCVLFECLTGRPPYEDPVEDAVLRLHQSAEVPDVLTRRPETPAPLAMAILRSMAKLPAERWATAESMRAVLPELEASSSV